MLTHSRIIHRVTISVKELPTARFAAAPLWRITLYPRCCSCQKNLVAGTRVHIGPLRRTHTTAERFGAHSYRAVRAQCFFNSFPGWRSARCGAARRKDDDRCYCCCFDLHHHVLTSSSIVGSIIADERALCARLDIFTTRHNFICNKKRRPSKRTAHLVPFVTNGKSVSTYSNR